MPTTTNIKREIKTVRTVTHSSTERFKTTVGASLTLSYKSPGLIGDVATGTFKGSFTLSGGKESAQLNKDTNGEIKWDIVRVSETQTNRCQLRVFLPDYHIPEEGQRAIQSYYTGPIYGQA